MVYGSVKKMPDCADAPGPVDSEKSKCEEVRTVAEVKAPMGGKILDVKVKVGDAVSDGDEVIILEAMKMELPIVAEASGTVKEIKCGKGDAVEADAVLVVLG
jgi:acetyl-CoA carboxylase biotin carboxyl carrier protein